MDAATNGTVPQQIVDRFGQALYGAAAPDVLQLQELLLLALAVDDWFSSLHPRYPLGGTTLISARRHYRNLRMELGRYNQGTEGTWVVPKAPLRPGAVDQPPSNTKLAGQFNSLSVGYLPAEAPRGVKVSVWDRARDVEPIAGTARIAFIPLAEEAGDLSFKVGHRGTATFLDVGVTDEAALKDRVERAVEVACTEGAHLCILPELCVSPAIADRIVDTLRRIGATSQLRLVVAGSGLHGMPNGRFRNACLVFDRIGRPLWRQDKINPYEMALKRMDEFRIPTTGLGGHVEDIQPADVLQVQDSEGLGRMMVLICEDLAQADPGTHACEAVPPDWVFAPILDGSIGTGRWVHQRGFSIAQSAHARVVVANSMTLNARKAVPDAANIGLCVDDTEPRRTKVVAHGGASPVVVIVDWDPRSWDQSTLDLRS